MRQTNYVRSLCTSVFTGGTIAASWTALMAVGQDGYMKMAKDLMEVTEFLKNEINSIEVRMIKLVKTLLCNINVCLLLCLLVVSFFVC